MMRRKVDTDTLWRRVQRAKLDWVLHCRFVNDNTALAVFANPAAASEALSRAESGQYKVRPFSEVCHICVNCAAALIGASFCCRLAVGFRVAAGQEHVL